MIPELLLQLCSEDMTPREHLEKQQALFKQFADICDFVLKFDDLKVLLYYYSIKTIFDCMSEARVISFKRILFL